jgi:hypothetical protein
MGAYLQYILEMLIERPYVLVITILGKHHYINMSSITIQAIWYVGTWSTPNIFLML